MRVMLAMVLMAAACLPGERDVECTGNDDCNLAAGGRCDRYEATGRLWCSYDSSDCPGGRVWGSQSVGDGLAGACQVDVVDAMPDAIVADADPAAPDADLTPDASPPDADPSVAPIGCWAIAWTCEAGCGVGQPDIPLKYADRVAISETLASYKSHVSVEYEKDHAGTIVGRCIDVPAGMDNTTDSREAYQICRDAERIGAVVTWDNPWSDPRRYRLSGQRSTQTCD